MHKKLQLYITPKAFEDLELIYEYTFLRWGTDQAEIYQDTLFNVISELLIHPIIGKIYETETLSYRTLVFQKHIIYYRQEELRIVIVRILHSSMDRDKWIT